MTLETTQDASKKGKKRNQKRNRKHKNGGDWAHHSPKQQCSGGLTEAVANGIYTGTSAKAKFWIWIAIAAILMVLNARFWVWFFATKAGVSVLVALFLGIGFSIISTIFEAAPGIRRKSARSALEQIFLAASKPGKLPYISARQSKRPGDIYDNYSGTETRNQADDESVKWILIGMESFIGIAFLSAVGTGFQAILAIFMFVASVFGAEHAIVKAVRVHESVLPPAVAAQLKRLWRTDKPLELE